MTSDYEQYLLQQQSEQSPRHNDMTLDERMTEYIELQNTYFDRDIVVDAHLEIIKLRAKVNAAEKIFALCGGLSELAKWENGQGKPQKKLIDEYLKLL
jgi:DNA-binding transcriptional regulator YiaG